MSDQSMQKFLFKARASGLEGRIRKPYHQDLGIHAPTQLFAGVAGKCSARCENFRLGNDLSYDLAATEITAESRGAIHRTVLTSRLENLRIRGRFSVELVVCRMESVYDTAHYPARRHSRISPSGSLIQGVRIDGKLHEPKHHPAFGHDEGTRQAFFEGKHDDHPDFHPGFVPDSLHIPDFGTIYFAEWAWVHPDEKHRQQLTMLRLALGSDFGADLTMATADGDGTGWPPVGL